MTTNRDILAKAMSEKALQANVVSRLKQYRWRYVHFLPATVRKGAWRTPYQGDGGFPDIIAVRGERCLAIELKSRTGSLDRGQNEWLEQLADAGIESYLWLPDSLLDGSVDEVLR